MSKVRSIIVDEWNVTKFMDVFNESRTLLSDNRVAIEVLHYSNVNKWHITFWANDKRYDKIFKTLITDGFMTIMEDDYYWQPFAEEVEVEEAE